MIAEFVEQIVLEAIVRQVNHGKTHGRPLLFVRAWREFQQKRPQYF